jgi:hypothetical protein
MKKMKIDKNHKKLKYIEFGSVVLF